jgi:hypothetical protein
VAGPGVRSRAGKNFPTRVFVSPVLLFRRSYLYIVSGFSGIFFFRRRVFFWALREKESGEKGRGPGGTSASA